MSGQGAPQEAFAAPDDHAIVVGINHYRPEFPILQGCINDAELFHEWLVSPTGGGLNPANVQLLVSSAPANPTDDAAWQPVRDTIYTRLIRYRKKRLETGQRVGRRLYLFYAGHGVAVPLRPGDAGIVMPNSEFPEPLFAVPGRQIIDAMQRDRTFDELVVFMDCCREVRGHGMVDAQITVTTIEDPEHRRGANYCCGFAAGWNDSTAELMLDHPLHPGRGQLIQGIFTHALLKALSSAAAGTTVDSHTLGELVKANVEALDAREDRRPRLNSSPKEDHPNPIVFAAPSAAQVAPLAAQTAAVNAEVEVTVQLSDPSRGFEVVGGDLQTIVLQSPGPAASVQSIRLRPGFYEFRPAVGAPPDPPVVHKIINPSSGRVILVEL
jgi:hypothetical protein